MSCMQSIKLCNIWLLPLKEIDRTNTLRSAVKVDTFAVCVAFLWIGQAWKVKWDNCFVEKNATCFRFVVCKQEPIASKCNRSDCIPQNYAEKRTQRILSGVESKTDEDLVVFIRWTVGPWTRYESSFSMLCCSSLYVKKNSNWWKEFNWIYLLFRGLCARVKNGKFILDVCTTIGIRYYLLRIESLHKLLKFFFSSTFVAWIFQLCGFIVSTVNM